MNEYDAVESLTRNRVRVDMKERIIYLDRQVGIKLWGVIDFLKKLKYRVQKG